MATVHTWSTPFGWVGSLPECGRVLLDAVNLSSFQGKNLPFLLPVFEHECANHTRALRSFGSRKQIRRCSGAVEKRDAGSHWNPNSVLAPVLLPSARFHRKLSTTRPQVDTSADKTDNEDQRLDGVEYARPKRATIAGTVDCIWDRSRSRWTALRMTRCRFLRGKGHQSFFLP